MLNLVRCHGAALGKARAHHDRAGDHVLESAAAVIHEYRQEAGSEGNRGEHDARQSQERPTGPQHTPSLARHTRIRSRRLPGVWPVVDQNVTK